MTTYADLRSALWTAWELMAQGPKADPEACDRAARGVLAAEAAVGEPTASALRRHTAEEWHTYTGCCPACGERGPIHPGDGSGAEPEPRGAASDVRSWRDAAWAKR